MTDAAAFRPIGPSTFAPTESAVAAWDPSLAHGAAVAALLAGRLLPEQGTLARLTIEFLAPMPLEAMTLDVSPLSGGSRVQRQQATVSVGDRLLVSARSVVVRRGELDLPASALAQTSPFDPTAVPTFDGPNRAAADIVGHESFDSLCVMTSRFRVDGDRRVHQWIALDRPIVEGTEVQGIELAVVAADYSQAGVFRDLSMADWSFRNAEQTIHLAREAVGDWVGVRCDSLVRPVGTGFNSGELFDADGPFGHSAASLVVEPRRRP